MWVAIHKCMEAMLGISLYSYLYLKLAKNAMSFLLSLMFFLNKIGEEEGGNRFSLEAAGGLGGHKQCIHMSKCKNDKIKGEEKNYCAAQSI
jgi:hypothetical protein